MEKEKLYKIFQKTDGYCHICHRKLCLINYGIHGSKGAWQIEHSKAWANGGSDHMNNLYPACIPCNIDKGTRHIKTVRSQYGTTRAPYSKAKKQKLKNDSIADGALIGVSIGFALGGPAGGLIGSFIGGLLGNESAPKK